MNEGDFCIISPFTQHSVLAAKDSLVLNIQLRKTTFDAILGSFLAKTDLLAIFFKNTLYETNQSNYLYFHTDNNDNIKMLIQNIVREANTEDNYSSTCCNGYVQILFSTLLRKYGKSALYYGFNEQDSIDTDFTFILVKKLESKSDIIQPITLVVLSNNIIIVARLNSGRKSESNREDCL